MHHKCVTPAGTVHHPNQENLENLGYLVVTAKSAIIAQYEAIDSVSNCATGQTLCLLSNPQVAVSLAAVLLIAYDTLFQALTRSCRSIHLVAQPIGIAF